MTLKTIYIARHGFRANWLPPPHPSNPTGIDSDHPLADHGIDQAKQLASYLESFPESERPQFILTSPFFRCVQTSEPIAEALSVPMVLERAVGEWYQKGRGVIPEPGNYELLGKFFSHLSEESLWKRDGLGIIPNSIGETAEEIVARCQKFWKSFVPIFEKKFPHVERILIVGHAASKIALGMTLMGYSSVHSPIDDKNTLLKAGACSLDKYDLEAGKWIIKMNGNCDFLSDGEEMDWNFYNQFEAGSDEDIKARQEAKKRQEMKKKTNEEQVTINEVSAHELETENNEEIEVCE